jgi:hypothetical protein
MRSLNGVWMVLVSGKIQSTGDLNTLQSFGFHRLGNARLVAIWCGDTAPANKQLLLSSTTRVHDCAAPEWQNCLAAAAVTQTPYLPGASGENIRSNCRL